MNPVEPGSVVKSTSQDNLISTPSDQELISLAEAAKLTPYSQEYISLLARRGKLLAWKKGRNWCTTREAVQSYLDKQTKDAAEKLERHQVVLESSKPEIKEVKPGIILSPEQLLPVAEIKVATPIVSEIKVSPEIKPEVPVVIPVEKVATAESSAVLAAREIANVLGETLGARFDSIKQELKQVNEQVSRSVPAYATPVPSAVVVKQNKIKSHWFYLALFLIAVPVIIFSLTQGLAEDAPGKLLASLKNAWTLDGHRAGTEANEVLILNEAGNISIKGHIETQGQLRSYARDGIAPIVVDSTTKIEKLNADAIDGYSSEQFNLAFITKQGNVTSDDVYLKGKVEVGQILEVKGATKLLDELLVGGGLGVWGKSFFHNDVAVDGKVDVSKSLAVKKDITAGGNVVAQNKVVAEKGLETGGDIVTNNNDIFLGSGTIIKEGKELIKNLNAEYWNGQAASDFNLDMITDNGAVTDNQITVGGINSTGTSRFTGRTELLGETVIGNLESLTVNGKTNLRNTDVSGTLAVAGHGLFSSLGVAGSAGVINLSSKEFSTTNASIGGSSSNTLAVAASSTFSGPISASNSVSLTSATPAISTSAGDLVLQSKGATTTANVQIGVGGDGSTTPDLLVLDVKSDATDPTGTDGAMYYNTSTDKFRCYENAAWTDCVGAGGGGGSTLQAAYVSGNTISTTTDDGDLAVTLADTTTDRNFTVTIADGATGTVSISRADGAGTSDPSQLLLLDNLDTNRSIADGLKIQSAAGLIVDGIDVSDAELTNALNVGDNIIAGTTAEINFSNFDLATSGNIQVAAGVGLDTNGAGSLTLGVSNATTIDIAGGSSSTGCTITNATGSLVCSGINSTPVGATSPSTGAFTTLSSTGATTLGNNSSTVAVDTTSWDISSAGAISGLTGLTVASGTVSLPNGQIDNSELANSTITFAGDTGSSTTALGATRTIAGGGGLTSADNSSGTLTLAVGAGTGITVNADDLAVNQSTAFAWTGQQSWTATVTATGALGDFNPTLGNDTDVDTVAGIQIDATSAATGDADNFYGLNITLASADATVNERAIEIGSGWDSALSVGGSSIINGSGVLQSAGLSGTYSNALTLSSATNSITAGTLIVGADTVTDLTGTGLQVVANALQATLGTDITSSEIADDSIMNVDINSAAAIAFSKLAALTSGNILVGNGSNVATSVAMSGDVLISNAGLTTIQPDAVVLATDTSGSYIATIAGSTQVGVSGSGLENAAVSLSINNDSIGDTQLAFDTGQTLTTTATPQFARLGVGVAADATNILTATSTSTTDLSKVLNISHTGAITGTGYASYFSKTGASTTNVGLYSTASGASNNYAAVFEAGNVGIGDTTPSSKLEIGDGTDSLQISTVGDLTFVDADGAASITGPAGGALTIASGASQALTLTGNAASIWDIGANVLSLQTTNNGAITTGTGLLTSGGNITFSGTSARTITGPNTGAAAALTLTTTGNGSGLKLTSAAGASGNSGAITLQSGDTATSGTSGAITIDSGAGVTANGVITIGTTNAPTTTIGGCTFDRVAGSMSCSGAVGGGTGTQGYWNRSGTTLSPATAGDSVSTSGAISTTGTGAVTSAGTLTASADFTANGNVQLGDNTADTLTIYPTAWTATPTISGLITATSGITSNGTATFNTNTNFTLAGAENVSLTNTTASADQLSLAVSGVTTDAVDGLAIAFTQADDADAADTNAALNISLTSSSTDADTLYGINLSNITAGTANEYAINIGTGYDRGINLGANSIVGSTGIIDYTNFDVDASGNVDALGTLTAGSANEVLTLSTGKIDADAITLAASGTTGSTSSRSGLQTSSDGLTLLMGCADGQLLEWTDASGWACAADDTGSSGASVEEGDSAAVAALSVLDFLAADFVVSESPANEANVSIDYPNSGITRKAQAETISGGWTFNTAATTFTTAINANGGITTTTADQNLAFSANGGGDFVFNVDSGTFVSITGTADGESALTIAAGNLTLTDGDLAVSAGDFNVNLDDGDTVNIDGDATPTADLLKLGNGDTSATDDVDALQITFATSGASGNLIDLSPTFADSDAGNSAETWNAVNVNAFTVTQNDSGGAITGVVNGFNLGNLTESPTGDDAITSTAIKLGTGWDYIFDTAGFDVLGATGATTITGSGDGTDALTLTAGDILVTNGDLDLSGGDFNVILDAGDGVNITKGAAPTVDVFSINGSTSTTDGVDGLQLTFGVSAASGNVIDITPSYTDATAGATSETYNIIDVDAFTATQNATGDTGLINGLAIGALTQTETAGALTAYALNIGSGWDSVLRVNGTEVVDASGNVPVARINGTLFTVQGDNAAGRAITQGNTLTIAGGTNLTSVDADTDTVTINLDDSITLAGDLTVQGQNVNFDNATDIDIDDNTASSFTISEGANNYFLITTTNDSEVVTLNLPAGGATSLTGNLFTSDIVKTINIGTGTAADTINLGTGTTNPDAINIGTTDTVAHVIRIGDNTGASSSDIAIADAQWSITTAGLITTADNLAVNGGDITTTATDPNIFNTGTISTIDIGATVTGNITFSNGSGSSGCTIDGSGNLACAGTITGSTSGAQGYWTRTSTTLSPTNAGDSIDMPSGTGVFTQTYAPAGTTVAATGATFIPTFGVHADNQTLVGVAINPVTNSNDDTGDILNALSIGTINATLASERAIYIGTSYDTDLVFGDTTPVVTFGDGGNLTFTDGTNTLLTLTDGGTVGNLSVSGDVTTTGDVAINGGNLNFGAATTIGDGGDTIAFSLKDNSADALDVQQSTNNYININTSDGNENIALSTLRQTGGDAISLLGDSITTGTAVGVSADVITTGVALDISSISTVASSADLIQVDHTATYVTTVANSGNLLDLSRALTTNTGGALTNSGAVATITSNCTQTAGTCTDTANILSLTQSYASASGAVIKTSNAGTGVDIELDNAETIDNSVNGTINLGTTTFKLTGGTTIVSDQATVALLDSTTTTINFGSAATAVNLADAAITGTIDIGGVTADGASTINIATNSTSSDTLVIGNSNASTLVTLTGGDDWSISNTGVLTLDGTTLDINSLDFVGAGTFTSGAATNLTLTPGTTGDLVFSTDADTTATFSGSADGTANVILTAGDLTLTDGDLAVSAGDFNVTLDAGDGVTITKNAVPTVDIFTISNTGQGITTTDGVDSLALTYVQATNAAAVAGSALDISVTQSGDASDTIRGININNITGGSSTETALSIGSGWDTDLAFVDTSPTVTIGGGGTITFTDGTNTLFSIADAGTTGNATTTGNLAVSGGDITTGAATFNFVAGTTTLNLAGGSGSTGCTVDGSGNLTCTGAITGSASGAQGYWTRTDNILTATNANDILSLPSNDADSPVLNLASSAITANGTASLNQAVTVSSSAAGVTAYGYKLALTNNPSTNANTLYGEYISFTDAGSLANTVTGLYVDATTANASDTTYSGVFTGGNFGIGDTSPAALLTVGSGDLFQVDSSGNVTAVDLAVNGGDITGATTMNVFNTSTTINLADAAITGTIDIGGVSTNGTTTVNIATEGTSADVITIGNSNASSTVAITGGNDWSIAANGNFVTLGTLTAGSGAEVITLSTGKIDADAISLMTATNGVGTTSTASGLEVVSDKLSLLQGCTDAYILKWEEDTDTWDCAADATGGGAGSLQGAYDGTNTITTSDNRDIAFTLADTNLTNTTPDANDSDFTVTTASGSTSETKIILADGVGTVSPTELLLINNADTSGNTLANGITVSSAGSAITTGINLTDADLVNAISVDANTILGTTGDINFTNFDVTGSSGDVVTGGDVAVNGGDITGATTMNVFNTSTLINLADSAITGTIDIGGVTADGATTINVATHSTSADVITIGNSNASTTVAITGGDDWAMAATGVLTMSASAAATTAIVITDTDYTNALSIGDNIITGTTYSLVGTSATIDFSEFDVAAATGAITINDDGDAGNISIEGTVLDINSLDFVGAGTLTSAATTNLTFTPGTTGDLVFSTDADTTATFSGSAEGTANVILTAGDLTLTDGDLTLSGGEIAATSDDATGTNFNFTTGALTSGTGLAVATTGAVATAYTGDVINGSFTQTVTSGTPFNNTGNVLDISRALTINQAAGDTVTQSGALVSFTSTLAAGGAGGTLADSSNILALAQSCGGGFSCTGAVLGITNAGTGSAIAIGAMSASSATTSVASIDIGAITTTNITTSTGLKIGALSGTGTTGYGIDIAGITKTGTTATAINIGAMSGAATTNTGIAIGNLSAGTTSNGITIGTNSSATSKGITIGAMTGATTNTGIDIGNISTGTTSKGINIGTLAGINGGTVTGIAISTMSGAATTTSATSIDIGAITTTNITTSTGLKIGALSGTGTTGYGIDIAGITKTGTTATAINIGAMSGAATTNTGIAIGNLSAGTTSKGITIGTNSSVTATGLDIGALSGTTANIGVKVGAISGASGTGTGLDIGAFTNTGATQYGVNIGAFSGTHAAGGGTTAGINIGNISSAGTTSSNYGIQLGTMTGGTTANYQISTGILTSATTTTNAQINLGGVVTTGGTTNYGINVGALSGTGTTNYGINVAALTSVGTTNYGLNVGGATGAATTNYGVFVGAVTGASTNISLAFAKENAHTIKVLDSTTADTVGGALSITAGAAANSTSTARAGGAITLTAGAGAANSSATTGQTAGAGGALNINTGNGGNETGNAAVVLNGGAGGAITIDLGDGGSPSGLSTAGSTGNGGVGGAWSLTSGAGGAVTNVSNLVPTRNGGDSGSISLITATGGETSCSACSPNSAQTFIGGAAGNINLTGGTGGAAFMSSDAGGTQSYTGGDGATINITAGTGGAASTTSADTNVGGAGGALSFSAGAGGAATNGTDTGGAGGDVTINAGDAGNGDGNVDGGDVTIYGGNADGSGVDGDVILAYTGAAVQGNVGIGTSTTTIQATAGYAGLHVNGLVRIINPQGTTTAPTLANEGEHAFATVSAVERMYVWINGARRYFNRTGSADFSEFVIKQDVVSSIVPGDVVTYLDSSTPRAGIILATNNNGGRVMGVVSAGGTRYNDDEGEGLRGDDPNYANVGMLGHVPVKVNLGNGPIVPGDYLVPSSTAGVAMKSPNEAGVMIGFAMESYDGSDADGQIMMFVSPGFYDPNANTYFSKSGGEVLGSMKVVSSGTPMEINLTGSTDINAVRNIFEAKLNGEMKFQILETGDATLSGKLNAGSLKTIAQAEIGGDLELSGDFKVGGLVRLDRNGNLKNITSVQVVSSVNADGSITLGTIPSTSVGSSVSIAQTSADPISATRAALALSSAGTSASDYLIYSEPFQVTYDGRVKSKSLEVKESVLVGGDNVTSGNLISGKVGDSFSGLLVKFTNSSGKSLFSIDGSGLLVVDAVKTRAIVIDNTDQPRATIGSAVVPAQSLVITVTAPEVRPGMKIFITPKIAISQSLAVTNIEQGSFTVSLAHRSASDVPFDWWLVDVTNPSFTASSQVVDSGNGGNSNEQGNGGNSVLPTDNTQPTTNNTVEPVASNEPVVDSTQPVASGTPVAPTTVQPTASVEPTSTESQPVASTTTEPAPTTAPITVTDSTPVASVSTPSAPEPTPNSTSTTTTTTEPIVNNTPTVQASIVAE